MSDDYDPDAPAALAGLLGAYVNQYWNDHLDYWEIPEYASGGEFTDSQRLWYRRMDQMGRSIRKLVHTLAPDADTARTVREFFQSATKDELTDDDAAAILKAIHNLPTVRDSVRISLAFEVTDELLPGAEKRVADLVALIARREISPAAASYLDRATRLYLWGFEPEAVIMCRSVLEAALESALREVIDLDEPPPRLDVLIRLAGEKGLLEGFEKASTRKGWRARRDSDLWRAEQIKWLGNAVVHDVPVVQAKFPSDVKDARGAIKELARVLDVSFPAR